MRKNIIDNIIDKEIWNRLPLQGCLETLCPCDSYGGLRLAGKCKLREISLLNVQLNSVLGYQLSYLSRPYDTLPYAHC